MLKVTDLLYKQKRNHNFTRNASLKDCLVAYSNILTSAGSVSEEAQPGLTFQIKTNKNCSSMGKEGTYSLLIPRPPTDTSRT